MLWYPIVINLPIVWFSILSPCISAKEKYVNIKHGLLHPTYQICLKANILLFILFLYLKTFRGGMFQHQSCKLGCLKREIFLLHWVKWNLDISICCKLAKTRGENVLLLWQSILFYMAIKYGKPIQDRMIFVKKKFLQHIFQKIRTYFDDHFISTGNII